MVELKEELDKEVEAAKAEYAKMEAHIRLYITEMDQAISS